MRQCGKILKNRTDHRWRMRIACWIPKAINTYSEYEIFIDFPLQQWLDERVSMLRYTYIAYLVISSHAWSQFGLLR